MPPKAIQTAEEGKRPRFFRLTKTKRRVLALLADYFCLRTKDLARLVFEREPTDSDLASTRRTLYGLRAQGLVHREFFFDLESEARTFAWGLTRRASREYGGKPFDEHSVRTIDHELEISYFHMALGDLGIPFTWYQKDLKRGIHPEAVIKIKTAQGDYPFFLEVERAKLGNVLNGEPSIMRKLARYVDLYDTAGCEKAWGFRKFRVIVVQRTERKRRHLLEALSKKHPYRMFWITTEPLYKEAIHGEIFRTPKDFEKAAYSLPSLLRPAEPFHLDLPAPAFSLSSAS